MIMVRQPSGSPSFTTDRRTLLGGAAALGAAAAIGATAAAPAALAAQGDELQIIIGTLGEANTINPFVANDSEADWRCTQLFDSVIRVDPSSYALVPGLASEWKVEDLVITFTIRDAGFSDGSTLTANDIAFMLQGILHPDTAAPRSSFYDMIAGAKDYMDGKADNVSGIEVVDDRTLKVTLAEPNAAFLYNMRFIKPVPAAQLEGKSLTDDPWFQKPVGAGPFQFESWTTGADFVMSANPNFWEEGKPAIKRVIHRTIADAQSLVLALQNAEIDGSNYPNPAAAEDLRAIPELDVLVPPFNSPNGWMFNLANEHLAKKEVRQGIAMALDTERFAADFLLGLGKAGVGPIAPDSWAFDKDLKPLPYDPEKAKQLISDAGAEGAEIRFNVNGGNILREDWLTYTQQALQDVGIKVVPELLEYATLVDAVTLNRDYEVTGVDFCGVTVEPSALYDQFHTDAPGNYMGYSNTELDGLLEEARRTLDQETAKPIYAQIQKILVDDVPFFFAWYRPFLHVVNKEKFGNYTDSAGDGLFYDLWNWTAAGAAPVASPAG
jgi:peptide/nickel transport system substrate-binding protein